MIPSHSVVDRLPLFRAWRTKTFAQIYFITMAINQTNAIYQVAWQIGHSLIWNSFGWFGRETQNLNLIRSFSIHKRYGFDQCEVVFKRNAIVISVWMPRPYFPDSIHQDDARRQINLSRKRGCDRARNFT